MAKERIQTYANGILAGVVNVEDVEKEEDYECEVPEGQEIDEFGTSSTIKDANFYNDDVKTPVGEDVDVDMKTELKKPGEFILYSYL